MKAKGIFSLFAILFTVQVFAQEEKDHPEKWGSDSLKCRQHFSMYNESLKQQMYKEAYKHWQIVMQICPANTESLYDNGIFLTSFLMKDASDERKKNLLDTAAWIYETRGKYFSTGNEWTAKYGSFIMDEYKDYNKAYKILKPIIDTWDKDITETYHIYHFSNALQYRFVKAKNKAQQDSMRMEGIKYYEILNRQLDIALASGQNESAVNKVREMVDKHFFKFASSCETVIPVLEKNFANLPEGKEEKIEVLKKNMGIMEKIECEGEDLYGLMLIELNKIDPSAEASYKEGNYFRKKKEYSKAKDAYQKAVDLCSDCEDKDKYKMGVVYTYYSLGAYKTIYSYAKGIGGSYKGEAYKYIAMSIASTAQSCGDTYFHRNLNYCLAYDYLEKAAANGEGVSSLKASYKSRFPSTAEGFELGINKGSSQTCSCWGENTIFRSRD